MSTTSTQSTTQQTEDASALATRVITAGLSTAGQSIVVKERTYVVQEVTVDAFLEIGNLLTEHAEAFAEAGLLSESAFDEIKGGDYASLVMKLAKVWKRIPSTVGTLLALMLSADQPDDPDYIRKHLKLSQLVTVLRAFMRANPWGDLAEGFFQLRQEWEETLSQLRSENAPTSSR